MQSARATLFFSHPLSYMFAFVKKKKKKNRGSYLARALDDDLCENRESGQTGKPKKNPEVNSRWTSIPS